MPHPVHIQGWLKVILWVFGKQGKPKELIAPGRIAQDGILVQFGHITDCLQKGQVILGLLDQI